MNKKKISDFIQQAYQNYHREWITIFFVVRRFVHAMQTLI